MKKFLFIPLVLVILSGCETAGAMKSTATNGVGNAFSCTQINASFSAYANDRNSLEAYKGIATMTGLSTKGFSTNTADTFYEKALAAANVALIVQGCPPINP